MVRVGSGSPPGRDPTALPYPEGPTAAQVFARVAPRLLDTASAEHRVDGRRPDLAPWSRSTPARASCSRRARRRPRARCPAGLPSAGPGPATPVVGEPPRGAEPAAYALGHRDGDGGVDGADPLDEAGRARPAACLDLGGIRDDSTEQDAEAPGVSATVAATSPAVSDSAQASVCRLGERGHECTRRPDRRHVSPAGRPPGGAGRPGLAAASARRLARRRAARRASCARSSRRSWAALKT